MAPPPRPARALLACLPMLTVVSGAVAPALPGIRAHFATAPGAELWARVVASSVGLAIIFGAPVAGILADRIGRRAIITAAICLYAAGGASGLVADSLPALIAGRVVLGLGVGAAIAAGGALVTDLLDPPERARFFALQGALASLGGAIALPLAGRLADLSWRGPFAIYPLALVLLPLARFLPAGAGPRPASAGAAPLPLRALASLYALAFGYMLVFYLLPTQIPFRLRGLDFTPGEIGLTLGLATVASMLASLAWGRLGASRPQPVGVALGLAFVAVGWLSAGLAGGAPGVVAGAAAAGAGAGTAFTALTTWLALLAPPSARGRAMAGLGTAVCVGQFLSPFGTAPLVASGGPAAALTSAGVLALAFAAVAGVLAARGAGGRAEVAGAAAQRE